MEKTAAQNKSEIDSIRYLTEKAYENEKNIMKLMTTLNSVDKEISPIIKAYHGVAICMTAKLYFWPWDKLNAVDQGLSVIDSAIISDERNVEIYLLKYLVLNNLPEFLGHGNAKLKTINKIYELFISTDEKLAPWVMKRVIRYLKNENKLTDEEINRLYYNLETNIK